jgi:phosphohistidine phosphatase
MPKRLILMRHAKSTWDKADMADFDRPLSARGQSAAPVIGAYLASRKLYPQLVLCSSARRAAQTWELASAALARDVKVTHSKSLYMAMPREMLKRIQRTPAEIECLLLVGHNPGIADLAGWLCGEGDDEKRTALARKYPTGAIAVIDFDVGSWGEVEADNGRLVDFVAPRQMAEP